MQNSQLVLFSELVPRTSRNKAEIKSTKKDSRFISLVNKSMDIRANIHDKSIDSIVKQLVIRL